MKPCHQYAITTLHSRSQLVPRVDEEKGAGARKKRGPFASLCKYLAKPVGAQIAHLFSQNPLNNVEGTAIRHLSIVINAVDPLELQSCVGNPKRLDETHIDRPSDRPNKQIDDRTRKSKPFAECSGRRETKEMFSNFARQIRVQN